MPDFFDVVHSQRACRNFTTDDVPDDLLAKVLDAATFAPSAENSQPWVFVVVKNEATRKRIAELTKQVWEGGARAYEEKHLDAHILADVDKGTAEGFARAPVVVVVGGDAGQAFASTLPSSVYPATQNLLLAATALGLGSALTTLATAMAKDLAQLVDLPEHVKPMAVVFLGWPAKKLGPPRRISYREKTHLDRHGQPFWRSWLSSRPTHDRQKGRRRRADYFFWSRPLGITMPTGWRCWPRVASKCWATPEGSQPPSFHIQAIWRGVWNTVKA
jgi:nitroreductase